MQEGVEVKSYSYYDAKTCGLDIDGMLKVSILMTISPSHNHHMGD